MKEKNQYNTNVTEVSKGLHTDNNPVSQPKGTYRFALNAINETKEGEHGFLSNESSNYACTNIPDEFIPIGDRYIEDDTSVVILSNPITGKDEIGTIDKNNIYTTHVNTGVLNLNVENQCDIVYRLRRGNEKVIYWVDGNNKARTFNLNRPYNFYNETYQNYLRAGGNPNTYVGEKWDASSFDLIKSYKQIPFFSNVEVLETGNILPGSYNFAIQYVDEDLNPTEWITTSNTVNIYNDTTSNSYERIRGSRNVDTTSQSFPRANKSIKLSLTNLDNSFPYYRVAIIQATGMIGIPTKALASDLYSTSDSSFIYTGNDGNLSEVALSDILIDEEVIFAPQHIEQLENRLILANTKGKGINWCEFQRYATKITSDLVTKEVLLNNILSEPNVKNPKSTFIYRGYMPGEVYSFGICYIFNDGTISPAFHIPGRSIANTTSKMKLYELTNKYLDVHNCATNNYWGVDANGTNIVGKKIRHHRFPFRKEVNKPLYTRSSSTTTINQYRLTVNITLNPAWVSPTSTPNVFPVDVNGDPLLLDADFRFKLSTQPSQDILSTQITDTDMGVDVQVYQDVTSLDIINPPDHYILDPTCELASYQLPTGSNYYLVPRFIITETYGTTILSSSVNDDKSEIFGIEFSNIEKPHPDIIGFYIVRNERQDDDRLIIDNAIFGPTISYNQYKSFGLIMPKQYGNKLTYHKKGSWFFNPEFEYFGKKTEFTSVEVEGVYTEDSVQLASVPNGSKGGPGYGVYINDVQAGTSYNPDVHKKKNKDDDGFDLLIGYRNTNVTYATNNSIIFPIKSRVVYLNAAAYQNYLSDTYYNVSVDNKIGFYITDNDFDTSTYYNTSTQKNGLIYASLVRNQNTCYSNFITRPYYKEHNNPILFGTNTTINNVSIYNGDAQISGFNLVSTIFYDMVVADRAKKSRVWKIIVGAILIVAGVLLTVFSGGASASLAIVGASMLAVSYGVSLAMSGIKFEQMKSMVDVDYEKGLKETVVDAGVYATIRDTVCKDDDTIRWFADRVSNIYIESSVPFGLRSGLTSGIPDFTDGPAPYNEDAFRTYLTEKLTVLDRDQGSGRLYKGYASAEVYDMNRDYMRFNKEKNFVHLPIEYDCCSDSNEIYPTRVWYSQQSFQEEKTDNYRSFLPNNYRDIEGEHGEITDLYRLGNALFIHTKEGLWHLPQNLQERVTDEIVTFIGTGEFFSVPPRKVIDDTLGSGGTQHKWGTVKTRNGVLFINEVENKVYVHSDNVQDISLKGMRNWFENNLKSFLSKQIFDKFKIKYQHDNNPANPNGVGYISTYDTRHERILITKRDYLLLSDKLQQVIMVATRPISGNQFCYALDDGYFYLGPNKIEFSNTDYFENKSWTISFSFHTAGWVSFHSYIPNYYIHSQNNLYSFIAGKNKIWKHNKPYHYQTFYDKYNPYIVEYVSLDNPIQDRIFEDLTLHTKAKKFDIGINDYVDERFITFNKAIIYNNRQCTGELILKVKDIQPNTEDWYYQQLNNNPGEILITRKERNWNLNEFRDNVIDYTKPFFSMSWDDLKSNYFIDKVVNSSVISFTKSWEQLESLRDKFIVIRLKFDNFDNVNLILNYSLETEQNSNR